MKLHQAELKTKTFITYSVVAILATALSFIYFYYSVRFVRDGLNFDTDEYPKDLTKSLMLRWIFSAIFTVGQTFTSVLMMCKLRKEFDDFFAEYGCFLWTVVTVQALSLLI